MPRIIVIGGSGFVGQELIRQLNNKATVIDIVKPASKSEYFYQDITKKIEFDFKPDDIVVHLAANQYHNKVPRKNRQEFFDSVNVNGTKNVLEKMYQDGAKNMVFFSTDMVYGLPQYLPVDTKHRKNPFGFYGKSKIKAEQVCDEYRSKGFNITIFRPRMIVGPGRFGILIKLFKLMDKNLPVPTIGSGKNCYQMISVSDCTSAILCAIKKGIPNKEYNLGSKNPPMVKDLLKSLIKKTGSNAFVVPTWGWLVKVILGALGKICLEIMYKEQYMIADKQYIVDTSNTERELDWEAKYNDTDMLVAAYESYEKSI